MEPPRKSSQEVEIDHLLVEEFSCDPTFAERFLAACSLECPGLTVSKAIAEPSLGGEGFGDILIEGKAMGLSVALLIEDKISAAPAVRQSERYATHAARMRLQGWDRVWTILVAPGSYGGERSKYNAHISLEAVANLLVSDEPLRLAHRRSIIGRALSKKASSGVIIPDLALHKLKSRYFEEASDWLKTEGVTFIFPALKESYYDGDSWIDKIRSPKLPSNFWLRHRLWTSVKESSGLVDLIAKPIEKPDEYVFEKERPAGALIAPFSKGKGMQISLSVPELRQSKRFDPEVARQAFHKMHFLVDWYVGKIGKV